MAHIRATRKWQGGPKKILECRLYRVWQEMRNRCKCQTHVRYQDYGGRGIYVCRAWDDYDAFRAWAIANGYRKGLQLDRVDNDGPYSPRNCRFATVMEQAANTRLNRHITFDGRTQHLAAWAREIGIHQTALRNRIKRWPFERAMSEPPRKQSN